MIQAARFLLLLAIAVVTASFAFGEDLGQLSLKKEAVDLLAAKQLGNPADDARETPFEVSHIGIGVVTITTGSGAEMFDTFAAQGMAKTLLETVSGARPLIKTWNVKNLNR